MVLENFIVDAPIVWDRVGKKIFENPHVKQGRKMRVQITNAGMVEDLSGYTLALGWKHTVSGVDGLDVFEDDSEANVGIFEMAYTENLMTNLGNLKASLVLTSVEDMVVAESNDFYVKVDDSPFGANAEQGVGSYTRLAQILLNEEIRQEAYLRNEALVGSIDDKFDAFIQTNIVQEEVAEVFNNLEETYAQDLLSVKNGLAHKVGGGVKAEPEDLSATTLGLVTGTGGPINLLSIPQDLSVTYEKLGTEIKDSIDAIANIVKNGNFANGVTGWTSEASTSATLNNVLTNTANGTLIIASLAQVLPVTNTKTYAKTKVRVTNADCIKIDFFITGGTDGLGSLAREYYFIDNPVMNQWYDISGIVDATTGTKLYIRHHYSTNALANGKKMEVKEILMVDLSETFGVGNEFTKIEMDSLLTKFPSSWFDGVANMFDARDINNSVKTAVADIGNIKTDILFAIENIVKNGNFANGVTGWTSEASTSATLNNVLTNTANGTLTIASLAQVLPVTNTKTYAKTKVRVTNADCIKIDFFITGGTDGLGSLAREYYFIDNPVMNQWYDISGIVDATTGTKLYIRHHYSTNALANGKKMEVKEILMVDLSETFGVDEEPTLIEMNTIIAGLPAFFDSANLFNAESILKKTRAITKEVAILTTVPDTFVNEIALMGSRVDDSIIREFTPVNTNWTGKTVCTIGDSITWYDGRAFTSTQVEEGQLAVGYQTYMRNALGCTVINKGRSGASMPVILDYEITPYSFSAVDAVTLTSGANDHRTGVLAGAVLAKGSAFDTTTYAGAMQAGIEKILSDNPVIKIMLITPIPGWFNNLGSTYKNEETISRDYVNIMNEIGTLYTLEVCDWYDSVGFHDLNIHTYIGDKLENDYYLHPRNIGFKRMAAVLLPFLVNNQPTA